VRYIWPSTLKYSDQYVLSAGVKSWLKFQNWWLFTIFYSLWRVCADHYSDVYEVFLKSTIPYLLSDMMYSLFNCTAIYCVWLSSLRYAIIDDLMVLTIPSVVLSTRLVSVTVWREADSYLAGKPVAEAYYSWYREGVYSLLSLHCYFDLLIDWSVCREVRLKLTIEEALCSDQKAYSTSDLWPCSG